MVTIVFIVSVYLLIVMAEIAVVLQHVQHGLWHAHPFMQLQGTEAIESENEGKEDGAHDGGANVTRVGRVEW